MGQMNKKKPACERQ